MGMPTVLGGPSSAPDPLYQALFESAAVGLAVVDGEGRFLEVNPRLCRLLGHTPEGLLESTCDHLLHEDDGSCREMIADVASGARGEFSVERRCRRADNGWTWVRIRATPLEVDPRGGGGARIVVVMEDIHERKHSEQVLRRNERLFREMLDALPAAIYTTDARGYVTHFNRAAAEFSGRDPQVGDHWCVTWKLYYADGRPMPHHKCPMAIALKEGRPVFGHETIAERPDGTRMWFMPYPVPLRDENNKIVGGINMLVDITERKHAEEDLRWHRDNLKGLVRERTAEALEANARMRHAERMAVIGTLSAGLGHDMANLLVPVHIRLEALSRMELADDANDHLLAIKSSAQYLQKLSGGLRLLATDTSHVAAGDPTYLRTWWNETGGVLRTVLAGTASLDVQPLPDAWVAMTQSALMQAVFNLVQNAGDVLRDRTDGRVTVGAEVDGDYVNVTVTDNGSGMTDEVRRRCLEPFFTTKHRSISTGLGLSIVYGLVTEVGGEVDIQSQLGQGTTFTLRLRRDTAPEERLRMKSRAALVQVGDARLRAIVAMELQALNCDVTLDPAAGAPELVVCDHWPLATEVGGRVVLLADGPNTPASAIALGSKPAVQAIRNALREVTAAWMRERRCHDHEGNGVDQDRVCG